MEEKKLQKMLILSVLSLLLTGGFGSCGYSGGSLRKLYSKKSEREGVSVKYSYYFSNDGSEVLHGKRVTRYGSDAIIIIEEFRDGQLEDLKGKAMHRYKSDQ